MKWLILSSVVLVAVEAAAQVPDRVPIPATRFHEVMDATFKQVEADYAVTWDRDTSAGVLVASKISRDETPRLFQAPSAVLVERAAAALNTSVEGAEAGIVVTPLSLFGVDTGPHVWTASVASLEGGRTRVTTGYVFQDSHRPGSYAALGFQFQGCDFDQKKQDKLKKELATYEGYFREVCEVLVPALPEPAASTRGNISWHDARIACGHEAEPSLPPGQIAKVYTLAFSATSISKALEHGRESLPSGDAARTELERRASAVSGQLERLEKFSPPSADDCIEDESLKAAIIRYSQKHGTTKFGVQLQYEAFPMRFGFNPDLAEGEETPEKELPRGEWAKIGMRADYETRLCGFSVQAGVGAERGRKELADDILWSLTPTASVSRVLTVVGDKGVGGKSLLVKNDGTLQPHLVGGLLLTSNIALQKAEGQVSPLNDFQATLYVDFRFTENLQARLGVPLKGENVEREATDAAPVKRDVQWSVPVFVTTVLKL
ncbi:hypothetical protein [Cystobacter fuscus]|uniref:hypothetical protein n=1 Tax=Cystobacter fuscus TaxID=43 RepID=UPI002B29EAC5|nr:hypothetical protein F0U63_00195 [Cystobacter fuscus]